jgi:hypothetical protein
MTPAISLLLKIKQIYQIYLFPSYPVPGIYYPPGTHMITYMFLTVYTLITGKVTSTTTVLVLVCVVHTHNVYY